MNPVEKHAGISPSKLGRILDCPGSLELVQDEASSIYAQEGTMLHHVMERYLTVSLLVNPTVLPYDDTIAFNINPELTEEQLGAIQDCVEYAHRLVLTAETPMVFLEDSVSMARYNSCLWDTGGTSDLIIIDTANQHAHVLDWKFGKGIPVYPDHNDQLLAYAAGALISKNILHSITDVTLHIAQPRLENFSSFSLPTTDLIYWLDERVLPNIKLAYSGKAPLVPGIKQCRWCPGSATCRARFDYMSAIAEDVFKAHAELDKLDYSDLAGLLARESELNKYFSDIKDYLYTKAKQGVEIPGYKLVAGRSIRMWSNANAAEEWLLDHFDISQVYEQKLLTPAKAEKLVRGLKNDPEFTALITKPLGEPTLVPESDKRAPYAYRTAEQIFGTIV